MLEVCVDSLESAINAIHGGADELEVCSSLPEGGLTPSPGLVTEILKMKPKVNVMIRCRTGAEFCYTAEEIDTMLSDIEFYKSLNIDRFVFGALSPSQEVEEENCLKILTGAQPIPVTFHRAFDMCKNPHIALEKIIKLGFNRVLTSGQQPSAGDVNAIKLLETLISNYGDKIEIMPGAGVNLNNAKAIKSTGCKIIHSSCKRFKQLICVENNLSMGKVSSEHVYVSDETIVRTLKKVFSD